MLSTGIALGCACMSKTLAVGSAAVLQVGHPSGERDGSRQRWWTERAGHHGIEPASHSKAICYPLWL